MIRNLLENARRYGNDSSIEASLRKGHEVELRVSDGGPGVPESEREKLFEPFYRLPGTKQRDGGVGLGLSLVRQIARHHGGSVTCEARSGGGTRFIVILHAAGD